VDSRCRGAESARPPPPPPPLDGRAAFACAAPAPPLETLERGRKGPGRGGGGAVRGAPGRGVEAAARRSGGGGVSTGVCGVSECACVQVGHLAGGGGRNFAECQITALGKDTTALPSALIWHSAKPLPLCRVPCWQHSAKPGFHFKILQFKIYLNIFL